MKRDYISCLDASLEENCHDIPWTEWVKTEEEKEEDEVEEDAEESIILLKSMGKGETGRTFRTHWFSSYISEHYWENMLF